MRVDDFISMNSGGVDDDERTFGWRGWILVVAIVFAFLIIPLLITRYPPTGISYRLAFLILPMIPAVIVAILAVWATTRP